MKIKIGKLLTEKKTILLAYDQGLEHGPTDFNEKSIDPEYILDIAVKGKYNGVILQHGIAEKYYENYKKSVPLIVKLNGKTSIPGIEPFSPQLCSVDRAVKLGADAVGYTVYVGSDMESKMTRAFSKIVEEAHSYGIPAILWSYPRGRTVADEKSTNITAYAARVALELGADFVKLNYNNDFEGFKWVVKSAGKTNVLSAGGSKISEEDLFKRTYEIINAGAVGLAIGRNVWQHKEPIKLTKALKTIVFENKKPEQAMKIMKK